MLSQLYKKNALRTNPNPPQGDPINQDGTGSGTGTGTGGGRGGNG